jgi:hypothetical protein
MRDERREQEKNRALYKLNFRPPSQGTALEGVSPQAAQTEQFYEEKWLAKLFKQN